VADNYAATIAVRDVYWNFSIPESERSRYFTFATPRTELTGTLSWSSGTLTGGDLWSSPPPVNTTNGFSHFVWGTNSPDITWWFSARDNWTAILFAVFLNGRKLSEYEVTIDLAAPHGLGDLQPGTMVRTTDDLARGRVASVPNDRQIKLIGVSGSFSHGATGKMLERVPL
jgi:hypothetical protein